MSWIPGKKYFEGGVCNIKRDLKDQVVVVTGSSSGIGKATARELAAQNATIVMATRNFEKTQPIIEEFKKETGNNNIEWIPLDIEDLKSVKNFAQTFKQNHEKLDILVNNAGVATLNPKREFTKDGYERQFGGTYLGHYYLTRLLLDNLKKSEQGRIIDINTKGATKGRMHFDDLMFAKKYDPMDGLFRAKTALLSFTTELQHRLQGSNVKIFSLHPGWVRSEGMYNLKMPFWTKLMFKTLAFALLYFGKDTKQGAQTGLYCALEDWKKLKGGAFYSDCAEFPFKPTDSLTEENRRKLWDISEQLIKDKMGPDAFKICKGPSIVNYLNHLFLVSLYEKYS